MTFWRCILIVSAQSLNTIVGTAKRGVVCAADKYLFCTPVITGIALEKLLGEGCVQDMGKVLKGANKLKKLARKYAEVGVAFTRFFVDVDSKQRPGLYESSEIIARLSFAGEFSARSWAQVREGCGGQHGRN